MKMITEDTLREAREKLLDRSVLLRDRLQRVQADLRHAKEPLPTDATDSVHESAEVLHAIEGSAYAELGRIETALAHVEDDTFGLCEECGREIEASRFVATPYARHCKACAPGA